MNRFISTTLRLAVVDKVDYETGLVYTNWIDQTNDKGPTVPMPHPFPGQKGEGIFVGIRRGTLIALGMLMNERYIPVAIIPNPGSYEDLLSLSESGFDDVGFPQLDSGDVILQGTTGSQLQFKNTGDITLKNNFEEGFSIGGDFSDSIRCSIYNNTPVCYSVSSSGISAQGLIRRDTRPQEGQDEFADYLNDLTVEKTLEEIGWDVSKNISLITRVGTAKGNSTNTNFKKFKNPAFVEKRNLIYEFGKDWDVRNFEEELGRLQGSEISISNPTNRNERRSNILNLSQNNPNLLIENVNGTLIDIFGNLLSINKDILPSPQGNSPSELLKSVFEINRHTVAFHMEINTKKGYGYREAISNTNKPVLTTDNISSASNNARDRSKWSVDIDKEGLTVVNIPSTSETGNVPLLTRQENSSFLNVNDKGELLSGKREDFDGLYRNSKNKDIFHEQFGPGGITIESSLNPIENRLQNKTSSWVEIESNISQTSAQKYLPQYVEAGTAFHDITQTAYFILKNNINKKAYDIFNQDDVKEDPPAISNEINAKVPEPKDYIANRNEISGLVENQPNAGGRSAQVNLDGSLEMSIGANTIDRVSWIIDTAGAIVSRLGRDRQGRSAIIQSDGSIILEIGGFDYIKENSSAVDSRFVTVNENRDKTLPGDPKQYRSGKFVMRIKRATPDGSGPDKDDNLLIIDDTGMTLVAAGRLNLVSGLDMTLKSDSKILFEAPIVQTYKDNPKFFVRDGRLL